MYNYPLFAPEQTSARIDFLRQGGWLVDEKDSHSVKILAEKFTVGVGNPVDELTSSLVNWSARQLINWSTR